MMLSSLMPLGLFEVRVNNCYESPLEQRLDIIIAVVFNKFTFLGSVILWTRVAGTQIDNAATGRLLWLNIATEAVCTSAFASPRS